MQATCPDTRLLSSWAEKQTPVCLTTKSVLSSLLLWLTFSTTTIKKKDEISKAGFTRDFGSSKRAYFQNGIPRRVPLVGTPCSQAHAPQTRTPPTRVCGEGVSEGREGGVTTREIQREGSLSQVHFNLPGVTETTGRAGQRLLSLRPGEVRGASGVRTPIGTVTTLISWERPGRQVAGQRSRSQRC